MYKEILKLNPNINLVYKDINNTSELNEFKKIFFKNLTNNFKNIKNGIKNILVFSISFSN